MKFKITVLSLIALLASSYAFGQATGDYQSHAGGLWSVNASWERFNGTSWVTPAPSPTSADGIITIQSGHIIQIGASVTADQIVINGTLQVLNNFTLTMGPAASGITVNNGGILEKQETNAGAAGTIALTSTTNTVFNSGAIYKHNYTNVAGGGNPVAATWNDGSEMQIVGYTAAMTIAGANWGGNFATVRYNCPNQANALVNFAGLLTTIRQDLIIEATTTAGTGRFMFNSTGSSTTTIGGNLSISGPSRMWLNTTGPNVTVNVGANFTFNPTIAGTSQLSGGASGIANLNVAGSATFSANNFTMASVAGGTGNLTVNNGNALNLNGGTLTVTTAATFGTLTLNGGGNFNVNAGNLNLATTGNGTINLNGGGNFNFSGTTLTLATTGTGNVNLNGGGNFTFNGTTLSLATTGTGTINVNGGSFLYQSGNINYATTTTGVGTINVTTGDFNMTSPGTMTFDSGTGSGRLNLIGGSFSATNGAISEAGGGTGTITFSGATNSTINAAPARFTIGTVAFTVNKPGGSLQIVTNDLTIGGTLTMTSGTLDLNGRTLTLNGAIAPNNWPTSGSSFTTTLPSSLIIQTAGGAFPTTNMAIQDGSSFTTFTMNRAGTLPIKGDFTTTTLNLNNGTLTSNVGALTSKGLTMADGGTIVRSLAAAILTNHPGAAGTYDVNYTNAAAITAAASFNELPTSATVLRDLNFSGAGAVTFPASLTSLTINRNLTINTGAGVVTGAANQTITVGGDFASGGAAPTFGQAGSTFIFSNTTAFPIGTHAVSGTAAPTFTSLTINGAVTESVGVTLAGTGNLTVNASSSLTASSGTVTNFSTNATTTTVTNSGTLNLNAVSINGTHILLAPATTMGISGNFSTAGTFTNNGGTVIFNGNATQTLSASEVYNNVTVRAGAIVSSVANQTINGVFKNLGSFSVGNLTLGTSSATTLRSGSTTSVNALTLTAPAAIAANGNLTVSGVLTIPNNSSIAASDTSSITKGTGNFVVTGPNGSYVSTGTTTFITGTTTFTGTGTKTFKDMVITTPGAVGMAAISYTVNGDISGTGTLNAGTGASIVTFGGTSQTISVANANFRNTVINNGSTVTAATSIAFTGNLTINGAFVHGNKTVTFTTAGAHSISGNPTTFFNLNIGNGVGNVTVTNSLTPLSLAGALNINGTTTNTFNTGGSANFILLSTGDVGNGTDGSLNGGSIGPITGTASLSGTLTVQRHMDSESRIWRYIASPVVGSTVADLKNAFPVTGTFSDPSACAACPLPYDPTSPSLYYYNESTQAYVAYPATGISSNDLVNAAITNGRGYSAYVRQDGLPGPATIKFQGTHPATGAGISLPIASSVNGYSLVGNPYPSAIVWDPTNSLGTNGWTGTANVSSSVKIRDNGSGGIYQTVGIGGTIAAGQAFWVQTTGASPVLTIHEPAKTSAISSTFYKIAAPLVDQLTIQMSKVHATGDKDKAQTDEAIIQIQPGSSNNFDYFDSPKWNNAIQGGANVFDFSILTSDAQSVTLNAVPSLSCSQQINLKIADLLYDSTGAAETSANYELTFNPSGGLKAMQWTLHDNATGSDIDISSNATYSFSVSSALTTFGIASRASNRFYLVISSPASINTSSAVSSASSVCTGADAVIKVASQPGMTYAVEVNGLLLPFNAQGDGNNISIFIPTDTLAAANTIRVKVNSGCDQQFLNQSVQIATENFAIAQARNVYRCSPGSVTLTATGAPSSGNYNWYADSTSVSPLFTGASFVTPSLSDTTTYYVSALNNTGCEGVRVPVQAQIGNNGDSLAIAQPFVPCSGTQGVLVAAGAPSGGTYHWYDASSVLIPGTSDTLKQILYKPTTFYVASVDASGCESNRISYMADAIKFYPNISTTLLNGAICKAGTQTISAATDVASTSTYRWYATVDAASPLTEDLTFITPTISATTDYYVSAVSASGCESAKQVFTVPVNTSDPSANLTYQAFPICASGGSSILVNGGSNVASINWYESLTAAAPFTATNEFDTPTLDSSTTYYFSAVDQSGCEGTKNPANVTLVNLDSVQLDKSNQLQLTVTNYTNVLWFLNGTALTAETNPTIVPKVGGDYGVLVTSKGCSTFSGNIIFAVTEIEKELSTAIILYPNPASSEIYVQYSGTDALSGQLFDITGKPISNLSLPGAQTTKIETKDLSRGLYIFKFTSGNEVSFKKFIIQ